MRTLDDVYSKVIKCHIKKSLLFYIRHKIHANICMNICIRDASAAKHTFSIILNSRYILRQSIINDYGFEKVEIGHGSIVL